MSFLQDKSDKTAKAEGRVIKDDPDDPDSEGEDEVKL